jgi:hypothetical protein
MRKPNEQGEPLLAEAISFGTKRQDPNSKLQRNTKLQISRVRAGREWAGLASALAALELGIWILFGAWSLEFGVSFNGFGG